MFCAVDCSATNLFEVSGKSAQKLIRIVIRLVPPEDDVAWLIFLINGSMIYIWTDIFILFKNEI